MKTSKCFKRIRDELITFNVPKGNHYICECADELLKEQDAAKVRRIISILLEGHLTLGVWLSRHNDEFNREFYVNFNKDSYIKLHNTCIAWLNHLIKHYESIGD